MRTAVRRILALALLVGGVILMLTGLIGIKWYVWDIVISQAGQPDRSMLFWGLPILFLAFGSAAAGTLLGWVGLNLTRRRPDQSADRETGAST